MLKMFLCLVLAVSLSFSATRSPEMVNAFVAVSDTLNVDGTDTAYSDLYRLDRGAYTMLVVEANDDSSAGFASDSAIVSIEMLQGYPDGVSHVRLLPSKAHPDSTSFPGGSAFVINSSLDIADMDTLSFLRDSTKVPKRGSDSTWIYKDVLTGTTSTGSMASAYYSIAPDWSPFVVFRLIGQTGNALRGSGSRWVLKIFTLNGEIVRQQ